MALVKSAFLTQFKSDIVETSVDESSDAAENWVDVYTTYAQNGVTAYGAQISSITPIAKTVLKGSLTTLFSNTEQTLGDFTSGINSAFIAFWLTTGNIVFTPITSIVTSVGGTLDFTGLNSNEEDVDAATEALVDIFHNFTKTVIVTDSSSAATGPLI